MSIFKQLKWKSLLLSLGLLAVGVFLILYPRISASIICSVIGIGAIAYGIINIISYFMLDLKDTLYRNEFMIGLLAVFFGIVVLTKQELLTELVPVLLGLAIIASGITKIQKSVVALRIKYDKWLTYLILGAVSILFGAVVMFYMPGRTAVDTLFISIGAGLVFCGISDLFVTLFLAGKLSSFIKQYEEAENGEVSVDKEIVEEMMKETEEENDIIEGEFIEKEPEDTGSETKE